MATKDFSKIGLGEGKLYINYGEIEEEEMGYVRGGEFNSNLTMRHIQVDGKKGHIKGDAVFEEGLPQIDFTALQLDASVLEDLFFGLTVTDNADGTGTVKKSNANPVDADYHTNVAFVGKTKDGSGIVIKLLNALGEGSLNFAFEDRSEIEIPCMFTGNYETIDDTEAPFEITIPYEDSVIV
jgi:hypothetical protein